MIEKLIESFIDEIQNDPDFIIYNEAGFQHELGFYLKQKLPQQFKVQLERNISSVLGTKNGLIKSEMDIFISDGITNYVIELKVPLNKQQPKRIVDTYKDIMFLRQLKKQKFECHFIFISHVKSFWDSKSNNKIYSYFNQGKIRRLKKSDVPKFLENSNVAFEPIGRYNFEWKELQIRSDSSTWKYFNIKI